MWNMKVPDAHGTRDIPDTATGVLDRSIAVLDAVQHGARTLAQVVEATGLPRTTAHRLLGALARHDLVEHVGGRGYLLGPRLLRIAAASLPEPSLRAVAHPALERLAGTTAESSQLYVRTIEGRVCIDAVESSKELRTFVRVGTELPVTAGSAGKVFMAWTPEPARSDLVSLARGYTTSTPTGERLRRQLAAVRKRGWASSAGEREEGVGSVSAPLLGSQGELLAAVSISGPTTRLTRVAAKRYAPAVMAAAREIEHALGMVRS